VSRVVVIGAGIAGLSAAYSLREQAGADGAGFELVVLEKRERPGGNITTERTRGFTIEGGPDLFLSEKPWALELCRRLGLEDELLCTNEEFSGTYVFSGGRLHELPEGVVLMIPTKMVPLAASSLLSIRAKLRMALEPFVPRRRETGDESLASFVKRRLGAEVLEKIAEPLVAGIHAGDPETMSVASSFPRFVELEQEYGSLIRGMLGRMKRMKAARGGRARPVKKTTMFMSLKRGLGELVETLASRIEEFEGTEIRTGVAVRGITRRDGRYEVAVEGAPGIEADAVVLAVPAWAAARLIGGLDEELSKRLIAIPYVSSATVSFGFRKSDVAHPMNGFGFVVPRVEKRGIMAATWTSRKFKHRAPDDAVLIRCFIGGPVKGHLVDLGDEEMSALALKELKEIMGIDAAPILTRIFRWRNAMPQYTIGHRERVAAIEERAAVHPGLFLVGNAYHGIGISDSVRVSEAAAKKILDYLDDRAAQSLFA